MTIGYSMDKQQLLNKAEELFMRYGIRSVSMDDIVRELGASKKTLYQFVENKSDLVREIFKARVARDRDHIEQMRSQTGSAIERLASVARFMIQQLRMISPSLRYDLEKYYQPVHQEMEQLHFRFFLAFVEENLELGIQQGLYRADLDVPITARLFLGMANQIGHHDLFPVESYSLEILVRQLFSYHLHSVVSAQGLSELNTLLASMNKE